MPEKPTLSLPEGLPLVVVEWLTRAACALVAAFGSELAALVLFGSAADGRMRASSDVNLLVVAQTLRASDMDAVAQELQDAQAAIELHPMFVRLDELPLAVESFAVKFEDILQRRVLIYGDDPFVKINVPREQLARQVRQILLNITLRLRSHYILYRSREEMLALVVADNAAPLRRCAHSILELRGEACPTAKQSLDKLAAELDPGFAEDLGALTTARTTLRLPADRAAHLILRLAELAEAMQALARHLP